MADSPDSTLIAGHPDASPRVNRRGPRATLQKQRYFRGGVMMMIPASAKVIAAESRQ